LHSTPSPTSIIFITRLLLQAKALNFTTRLLLCRLVPLRASSYGVERIKKGEERKCNFKKADRLNSVTFRAGEEACDQGVVLQAFRPQEFRLPPSPLTVFRQLNKLPIELYSSMRRNKNISMKTNSRCWKYWGLFLKVRFFVFVRMRGCLSMSCTT
jgi:hypothetical protein